MMRVLTNLPRSVAISLSVIVAALVVFAVLVPVLGGARDDALSNNAKLKAEISRVTAAITQSKSDADYVAEHAAQFEALLRSDRLVPHTRRAATVDLENAARANGLTTLNYNFAAAPPANSLKAVESQPASDAYHVSIENINLTVGATVDGSIYKFLADITDSFPGSAIIQTVTLARAGVISAAALDAVSKGQDAQLVQGTILFSWRTAQAKETQGTEKNKK